MVTEIQQSTEVLPRFGTSEVKFCPFCKASATEASDILETPVSRAFTSSLILRCSKCGLYYKKNVPTSETLSQIYDEGYGPYSPSAYARKILLSRLKEVERYAKIGRLLDVGAAAGTLVDVALERGWDAFGIEPFEGAYKNMPKHLVPRIQKTYLDDTYALDHRFDLVTAYAVIEHVPNPREFLQNAVRILEPGGILVLLTPNFTPLRRNSSKFVQYHLMTPDHLSFWTPELFRRHLPGMGLSIRKLYSCGMPSGTANSIISAKTLLRKFGFRSVAQSQSQPQLRTSTADENQSTSTIDYLSKMWIIGGKVLQNALLRKVARDTIRYLWLGDDITIIAQKKI